MLPYMDVIRCLQVVKQLTVVYIYKSYPTAGDQGDYSGTESSKHQLVRERLLAERSWKPCPKLVNKTNAGVVYDCCLGYLRDYVILYTTQLYGVYFINQHLDSY